MNITILNPFLAAAKEVVQAEVQLEVTRGDLALQRSAFTSQDLTVLISLAGDIEGVVLYGLTTQTALALVSRMLDQEFKEMDAMAQSGISELANVITGRSTVNLSEAGFTCDISPPTLVQGQSIEISTVEFQRVVVPLETEVGIITAHLALREAQASADNMPYIPIQVETASPNGA
ncbi:MAG: chemotaxis protein CheX [Chloroflexi bacterium]|nr:MAG: chemotaxis protein CheX [Chloroflexota bacterium]MBL1194859.1 chemotaxis protein CheX [Chloroflexota bacterium]NOH12150.1 chemotaxis protein CheX [Chloroflexota bacterium]